MFYETSQDLFTFPKTYIRVIPVNCVGVMGAGIAKQFKARHPHLYQSYRRLAQRGIYRPGKILWHTDLYWFATTKDHFSSPTKPEWIIAILNHLAGRQAEPDVHLALPAIGCGLGGLNYEWLRAEVEARFTNHPTIHVALIKPRGPGGRS